MFNYIANALAVNWIQTAAAVSATTTPTAVDIKNATGPVMLSVSIPSGGSGTLSLQPVMSTNNSTFVNVPADAILTSAGVATTFTNTTSVASTQTVFLKRDELMRYISITETPVVSASQTVSVVEAHQVAYTSLSV